MLFVCIVLSPLCDSLHSSFYSLTFSSFSRLREESIVKGWIGTDSAKAPLVFPLSIIASLLTMLKSSGMYSSSSEVAEGAVEDEVIMPNRPKSLL
jgi:hypothetical protein